MKRYLLLIILGIMLLSLVAFDDPGGRVWVGPELQGEWIWNAETGEFWYFHAPPEDDALTCKGCHQGFDTPPMWFCGDGWVSDPDF